MSEGMGGVDRRTALNAILKLILIVLHKPKMLGSDTSM
jgi:hypothetical protein